MARLLGRLEGQHPKNIFSVIFGPLATNEKTTFLKFEKQFFSLHPTAQLLGNGFMNSSAACDCGADNETAEHIIAHCPLFSPLHGTTGSVHLDDDTITWLRGSCPDI